MRLEGATFPVLDDDDDVFSIFPRARNPPHAVFRPGRVYCWPVVATSISSRKVREDPPVKPEQHAAAPKPLRMTRSIKAYRAKRPGGRCWRSARTSHVTRRRIDRVAGNTRGPLVKQREAAAAETVRSVVGGRLVGPDRSEVSVEEFDVRQRLPNWLAWTCLRIVYFLVHRGSKVRIIQW